MQLYTYYVHGRGAIRIVQCNSIRIQHGTLQYKLTIYAYVNQMRQVGLYRVYVFMHRQRRLEVLVSMSVGCPMVINVAALTHWKIFALSSRSESQIQFVPVINSIDDSHHCSTTILYVWY